MFSFLWNFDRKVFFDKIDLETSPLKSFQFLEKLPEKCSETSVIKISDFFSFNILILSFDGFSFFFHETYAIYFFKCYGWHYFSRKKM